jgi:hypothetical protein
VKRPRRRRFVVIAAVVVGLALAILGVARLVADDTEAVADPAELEGTWTVSLVIGSVDAEPGAEVAFPTDASYVETWVFDDCDDVGCTLRRPDGGFLFGDLDGLRVERGDGTGLDGGSELRFLGDGHGAEALGVDPAEGGPCDGGPTQAWTVHLELGVRDQVLSGSAFRVPDARTAEVAGVTCYGYDLTLGLSGTPAR